MLRLRKSLVSFAAKRSACPTVAWSPDGKTLACANTTDDVLGTAFALVDVESGAARVAKPAADGALPGIRPCAFSPNGTLVAVGTRRREVQLFDAATLHHVRTVGGFGDWLASLAFSRDGKQLAAASKGTVRVVSTASGEDVRTVDSGEKGWVQRLIYGKDGALYVAAGASPARFNAQGVKTATFVAKKKGYALSDIALGGDCLAGVAHFGPSTLWDLASQVIRLQPKGLTDGRAVVASADGKSFAHLDGKGELSLVAADTGATIASLSLSWPTSDDSMFTCSLAFSPDGKRLACGHAWGVAEIDVQ